MKLFMNVLGISRVLFCWDTMVFSFSD